jgi:hypothetical protein
MVRFYVWLIILLPAYLCASEPLLSAAERYEAATLDDVEAGAGMAAGLPTVAPPSPTVTLPSPSNIAITITSIERDSLIHNAHVLTKTRNIEYIGAAEAFWYRTSTVCDALGEVFLAIAPAITFGSSIVSADNQSYVTFAGGACGVVGLGLKKFAAKAKEFKITRRAELDDAIKEQSNLLKSITKAAED